MSFISSREHKNNSIISDGNITILDSICPSYLDITNPKFIEIDNCFVSTLLIVDYCKEMNDTFLKACVSLDLDVQISMFYEKQNSYDVIKELTFNIGNTGANIKSSNENQTDIDILGSSYQDAKYIRRELQTGGEDFYYLHTYITVYSNSKENLESDLQKIEGLLASIGLSCRRANFRQEQALKSTMPFMQNQKDTKTLTCRNILTSGLVCTYPFISNELCDENGVAIGINDSNHSLVMIDRFETSKYRNANMCVLGTSGSGKSYFVKLMIARNRYLNINQYIIDPDREYIELCNALDGTIIKFGSDYSINIMDIRKSSSDSTANEGYLRNKIEKLIIFFELLIGNLTIEEKSILEEKIVECYTQKGITFDDNSLYSGIDGNLLGKRMFKDSSEMPILEDLYNVIKKDKKLKRISLGLKSTITGSLKFLNNYTNVDLNNKLVVIDVYDIENESLAPAMFVATDFFWDKIKEERSQKKILYFDEAWRLIDNNDETADFVFKIFKTIRKYGRSCHSNYSRHK